MGFDATNTFAPARVTIAQWLHATAKEHEVGHHRRRDCLRRQQDGIKWMDARVAEEICEELVNAQKSLSISGPDPFSSRGSDPVHLMSQCRCDSASSTRRMDALSHFSMLTTRRSQDGRASRYTTIGTKRRSSSQSHLLLMASNKRWR